MTRRLAAQVVVAAGTVVGIGAEVVAYDLVEFRDWGPDLAVGLTFIVTSGITLRYRRDVGLLLLGTALSWFAGTVEPSLLHLHRGPLVHVLLASTTRRRSLWIVVAITLGYAAALFPGVWRADGSAFVVAAILVLLTAADAVSSRSRPGWSFRLATVAVFGLVIAGGVAARALISGTAVIEMVLVAYQATVAGLAVAVAAHVRPPRTDAVADLVVELGTTHTPSLSDALARTLGDPTLELGYWSDEDGYVDAVGRPIDVPTLDGTRTATFVTQADRSLAVLVHDVAVLGDPALRAAVEVVTRLSAANTALTHELRAQVETLDASRRRLVVAADEERQRLARRLHSMVEAPLADLVTELDAAARGDDHLQQAAGHLEGTLADLAELAGGLHPRELDGGLTSALHLLAGRCPVPVEVRDPGPLELTVEVEIAAYYLVAEALTNVAKHADASHALVGISWEEGTLWVEVVDDGRGGASLARGSGLAGLRDRVEALGGTLEVAGPGQEGTRVRALLPVEPGERLTG